MDPGGPLPRLPPELLIGICKAMHCSSCVHEDESCSCLSAPSGANGCKISTLSAFARTCRRIHDIANPILHKTELQQCFAYGLLWAAKNGRVDSFNNFIQHGGLAYVNSTAFSAECRYSLGDRAAFRVRKHEELFERLLPGVLEQRDWWQCCDPPESMNYIFAPLALAAMYGQDKIIIRLLECGARIGTAALNMCTCPNDIDAILKCMQSGLGSTLRSFWTPLHLAACHGHLSTVKLLILRGSNPGMVTKFPAKGRGTALDAAAFRNQLPVMDYLLKERDFTVDQGCHKNSLYFAVLRMGNISGVKLLIEAGADFESRRIQSLFHPAHYACAFGNFEVALFLLDEMVRLGDTLRFFAEMVHGCLITRVKQPAAQFFRGREESIPGWDHSLWQKQQAELIQRMEKIRSHPFRSHPWTSR